MESCTHFIWLSRSMLLFVNICYLCFLVRILWLCCDVFIQYQPVLIYFDGCSGCLSPCKIHLLCICVNSFAFFSVCIHLHLLFSGQTPCTWTVSWQEKTSYSETKTCDHTERHIMEMLRVQGLPSVKDSVSLIDDTRARAISIQSYIRQLFTSLPLFVL